MHQQPVSLRIARLSSSEHVERVKKRESRRLHRDVANDDLTYFGEALIKKVT